MSVPAAKVKSLCTQSEAELVRASRKPELKQLTPAEVKRLSVRARKLFDKWQGLGRGQSRARTRQVGAGTADANTELKAQIFREALTSFETRLGELDGSSQKPSEKRASEKRSAEKRPGKPKAARAVEHRAARASVRKSLAAVEDSLKREGIKKKKKAH